MKRRKKNAKSLATVPARDEPPSRRSADKSEPAEQERSEQYDVERDDVSLEVGPHDPRVDPRLEH